MENKKKKDADAELYDQIYKNLKMGAETTTTMIGRLSEGELKTELGRELAMYESLAREAGKALDQLGQTPKEEGPMTRFSAKAGVMMNTMVDATPSHIAGMVREGCAMGTSELIKHIHIGQREGGLDESAPSVALARRAISFEEDCAKRMEQYL